MALGTRYSWMTSLVLGVASSMTRNKLLIWALCKGGTYSIGGIFLYFVVVVWSERKGC